MSGFRLSQLLRLRRIEEDRAAVDLSLRHGVRRSRDQAARDMALRLGGMTAPSDTEAVAFRAAVTSRLARAGELSVARAALASAESEVSAATDEWIAARGRVKSLDNLQERWKAEQAREALRAEQVAVDDLVTSRWASPAAPDRPLKNDDIDVDTRQDSTACGDDSDEREDRPR